MASHTPVNPVQLTVRPFGVVRDPITQIDEQVHEYIWTNSVTNTVIKVISYGAIIRSIIVPDINGSVADIVMGFDTLEEYFNPKNPYFGALIGRVANRIADANFTLNGKNYALATNVNGKHHLHGGRIGFDKFNWKGHVDATTTKVTLTHTNPDGYEGYPGDVMAQITMHLTADNRFVMDLQATVSQETPLNLTNHSYFNLDGHGAGRDSLLRHWISINSDRITETDPVHSIPTGTFLSVLGQPFDLRIHKPIGPEMAKLSNGFDDNFCVTKGSEQGVAFVALVTHPGSGRSLEVYSDQPGVQLYTSNYLPLPNDPASQQLIGKGGCRYEKQGALCLETQNYPDAIHHKHFPSPIVRPGEIYKRMTSFKFSN